MTTFDLTISRRIALAAAGAAGIAAAVAACSSAGSPAGAPATPQGAPSPGGDSTGQTLATLDKIPVGHAVSATLDGNPIVVARPSAQQAACFSAICTHMGCTVLPAGKQLHCPCHGSVYNAVTGHVISGPAPRPLPRIPVAVKNGEVVTAAAVS